MEKKTILWKTERGLNNSFRKVCNILAPVGTQGIRILCQQWSPWAGRTECTNSLPPLMVHQALNLGPWNNKYRDVWKVEKVKAKAVKRLRQKGGCHSSVHEKWVLGRKFLTEFAVHQMAPLSGEANKSKFCVPNAYWNESSALIS